MVKTSDVVASFSVAKPYMRYVTFTAGMVLSTPILFIEFSKDYPLLV